MKSQIQPSLYSVLWLPFERGAALNPLLRAYDEFASLRCSSDNLWLFHIYKYNYLD